MTLRGIDPRLSPDIVHALMRMGHGDDVLVCDVNHPAASIAAQTVTGRVLDMAGCDIPTAVRAILTLMPLDTFVDAPITRMEIVGNPTASLPIFTLIAKIAEAAESRAIRLNPLERFAFYAAARQAFAVIRTSDSGPYGCFLLKKGVIDRPPLV